MKDITQLYQDNYYALFGIAFRITRSREDAEDIVASVFVTYIQLEKVPNNPEAFIWTMTKNRALTHNAGKKNRQSREFSYMQMSFDSPAADLENIKGAVIRAIEQLPQLQAEIMRQYFCGRKVQEIADELHVNNQTVRNYKLLALKKLQTMLKGFLTQDYGK